MKYDKREIMKEAHKRYKFDSERYHDAELKFGEYLEMVWFEQKIDVYIEANIVDRNDTDFDACYDMI